MPNTPKRILLSLALAAFCFVNAIAQQASLNWVNDHALSINNNDKYLSYLADQLKENTILGLGEASHGTHEFSVEKNHIIQYLITNKNYKFIGFESAYAVMERINTYVLTGKGDLKQIMQPLRLFCTKEIYDLFQAIKVYNDNQPLKNKVTLFGFDIDYTKNDIDSSANYCLNYLGKYPDQYPHAKAAMPILKRITAPDFGNLYELSDDEMAIISGLNDAVKAKGQSGDKDFGQFKKRLSLLYQGTLVSNPLARDEFMAENIAGIQQKNKAKTIIWSHNVHVAKDTTMAMCKGMGYYVRQKYGSQYYTIAFDTFKGSVNSIVDDAFQQNSFEMQSSSLSALFAKAKSPSFLINVDNAQGNTLYNIAGNITNIFSNWGSMRTLQIRPGIDFDALVFIRETTASNLLK
jgi:erythromycin esterase-like protein